MVNTQISLGITEGEKEEMDEEQHEQCIHVYVEHYSHKFASNCVIMSDTD